MRLIKNLHRRLRWLASFMCLCLLVNIYCLPVMGEELSEERDCTEESLPGESVTEEGVTEDSIPEEDVTEEPVPVSDNAQASPESPEETLSEDVAPVGSAEEEVAVEVPEEVSVSEDGLSVPDNEELPAEVFNSNGYYKNYLPTGEDDTPEELAAKRISFNGIGWYIISDNSTSEKEGSVTLLAADFISQCQFWQSPTSKGYNGSEIQQYLSTETQKGGSFYNVAEGIRNVTLSDANNLEAKLYLLSENEAEVLPENVLKHKDKWWLRTPVLDPMNPMSMKVMFVNPDGSVDKNGDSVTSSHDVRPALQLDLSKVIFNSNENSGKRSFYLSDTENYTVTFKVKNGSWNDGTKADKTVTLSRHVGEDLVLTLENGDIPAVGNRPFKGCGEGAWDITPTTEKAVNKDETYTYTYKNTRTIGLGTGAIGTPVPADDLNVLGKWNGSYVYYGRYAGKNMKYRVLSLSGFSGNTLLLDCDSSIVKKRFDDDSNDWENSELKEWLNGNEFLGDEANPAGAFTLQERTAISNTTKTSRTTDDGTVLSNMDGDYSFVPLNGEKIFLLDICEAENHTYGYPNTTNALSQRRKTGTAGKDYYWFLRSRNSEKKRIGCVQYDGKIFPIVPNKEEHEVSPAFNVNLKSILFSSVVSGNAGELGAEYKLTLSDNDLHTALQDGKTATRTGSTVTVPFSITGGHAPSANRVVVLLIDEPYSPGNAGTGEYEILKLDTDITSGTGTFTLPEAYAGKTSGKDYYAYILAETVNGEKDTDYASLPFIISIPDKKEEPVNPDEPDEPEAKEGLWVKGISKNGYPYTGSRIKPVVSVYYNGALLYEKTDYTLNYSNNVKVGEGKLKIRGKGNFKDSKTVSFNIIKAELSGAYVPEDIVEAYKKGKKHNKVKPALYMNGTKLKFGKNDLRYSYLDVSGNASQCIEEGNYIIRVSANSSCKNYTGYVDIPMLVTTKLMMKNARVKVKPAKYTGKPVTPELKVSLKKTSLVEGRDYSVIFNDSRTEPGKHYLVLSGNGKDYFGKKRVSFKITGKYDLSDTNFTRVTLSGSGRQYKKGGAKPKVSVLYNGKALKEGKDYKVAYSNNKKTGETAVASVKGKGSCGGKCELSFKVDKCNISTLNITASDRAESKTAGDFKKTAIIFTDEDGHDQKLKAGKDYNAVFTPAEGTPKAGTAVTVNLTGTGNNYTGTATVTYRIKDPAYDLSKARVTVNKGKAYDYTGKAISPNANNIVLTIGKKTVSGTDYEITGYFNNVNKGTATLTLKGKGDYYGDRTVTYKIGTTKLETVWGGIMNRLNRIIEPGLKRIR
ncbi:MAG: DUF6273 domain-containing protein [Lachnospiraceae bacterium]|nr:DUF6273 domain-containing protein [Lachnospiraceae bacterium]